MTGAPTVPTDLLKPMAGAPGAAQAGSPAKARETAEAFEASMLSAMLQPMFASLSTEAPFGGGQGEASFKSFLVDEMAKKIAAGGGLGLADAVTRELLKLQEAA